MWLNTWSGKRKKEQPNQLRSKPTIGFRSDLSPGALGYIKKLSKTKQKSDFINQAIEQRYFLVINKKQFLKQILQEDYALCRFLLRKIGNEKEKNREKIREYHKEWRKNRRKINELE